MVTRITNEAERRILLVEDNPAHAELVIRSLEEHPVPSDIYYATDGEMALNYLFHRGQYSDPQQNPLPHIILLDIRMPKVDGLEVLQAIKAEPTLKSIPVIMLTTSNAEQDVAQAYKNHANSYLVKPVDFNQFVKLMEEFGFYWLNLNHLKRSVDTP